MKVTDFYRAVQRGIAANGRPGQLFMEIGDELVFLWFPRRLGSRLPYAVCQVNLESVDRQPELAAEVVVGELCRHADLASAS